MILCSRALYQCNVTNVADFTGVPDVTGITNGTKDTDVSLLHPEFSGLSCLPGRSSMSLFGIAWLSLSMVQSVVLVIQQASTQPQAVLACPASGQHKCGGSH